MEDAAGPAADYVGAKAKQQALCGGQSGGDEVKVGEVEVEVEMRRSRRSFKKAHKSED